LYATSDINTVDRDFRDRIKSAAESKVSEFGFGFDGSKQIQLEIDGSDKLLIIDN
jgi:hypothetical protein